MAEGKSQHPSQNDVESGYELSDVNVRRILAVVAIIAIFLAVAFIVLNSFFISQRDRIEYQEVLKPTSKKLRQLHQREQKALNSFALADTSQGIYQIPVERAMELEAQDEFQRRVRQRGTQ